MQKISIVNENTLIAVFGYGPSRNPDEAWFVSRKGDVDRIKMLMPYYEHHKCPIVFMSPSDAPITSMGGHICRSAGKRAYIGQTSLDRQRDHLRILLEYPQEYFLLNDSDSCCFTPEIPRYVYDNCDGIFWSNEITESRPHESPYPKIAMQPPYFLNRKSLATMLAVADRIVAHPITPFIDHYMLQLVCESGLKHESFLDHIEDRRIFLHPVKTTDDLVNCQCINEPKS